LEMTHTELRWKYSPRSEGACLHREWERNSGLEGLGRPGSGAGLLLLSLALDGALEGRARVSETRWGGNDLRGERHGIGDRDGSGIEKGLKQVGRGTRRFAGGIALVKHPPRQHGFGRFLNPLVNQGANFAT
jgi:hypothetical protein